MEKLHQCLEIILHTHNYKNYVLSLDKVLGRGTNETANESWYGVLVPTSYGLAEGSVNKLKVTKWIIYGRSSFILLRNKILLKEFGWGFN